MARVLFLSESTLKAESILQDNVDMKVVTPTIYDVQNYYILPILGTTLYNELVAQVLAGSLNGANKTLMDTYIQPAMIWYTRLELPMNMNYKYFNKSVGVQNADNMNPASLDEIRAIEDRARNKAEFYAERLTKFLLSNPTIYPSYLTQTDPNIDTLYPKRTNYTSGMVLGDTSCCFGENNFRGIPIDRGRKEYCKYC